MSPPFAVDEWILCSLLLSVDLGIGLFINYKDYYIWNQLTKFHQSKPKFAAIGCHIETLNMLGESRKQEDLNDAEGKAITIKVTANFFIFRHLFGE